MRTYEIHDGHVYCTEGNARFLIGFVQYTETIRFDNETVADVTYEFDFDQGRYVELSRVERAEPLPPEPPMPEEEITALKLALAELAELLAGGES